MNNLVLDLNELGYKNNSGINFPTQGYTKLGNLKFDERATNRDLNEKHVNTMTSKIREYGFLDSVKVFPPGKDGKFIVAESQHRVEALKSLIQSNPPEDTYIPISVLHWIDPSDQEDVQNTILCLNMGAKNWTIYDFVKSNSKVTLRKNHKDFQEILESMRSNKLLTNNIVAQIYSGQMMTHEKLRDGSYLITSKMRPYYNLMLEDISAFVASKGKDNVKNLFLRFLIQELHSVIKSLHVINDEKSLPSYSTFNKVLQRALTEASVIIKTPNSYLPTTSEHFNQWFDEIREEFIPDSFKKSS
jgi:hypothetical protein